MLSVSKGPAPDCLSRYSSYEDLRGSPCQQELRDRLSAEQGGYCVYCERVLSDSGHLRLTVEHTKPKNRFPGLQVEWPNLIGSCAHQRTCNQHKGHQYAEEFIDPVAERPADFLELLPGTGDVSPRDSLCTRCRSRAEYTLGVLNLNHSSLRYARREACRGAQEASHVDIQPAEYLRETLGREDFVPMMRTVFGVDKAALGPECPGCGRANP